MGRIKELLLDKNYAGVLNHDGSLMVAKSSIQAKILYINQNKYGEYLDVLVLGRKGSYVAKIHQRLKKDMVFVDIGDCALIKWKNGSAWMVGFQKKKSYQTKQAENLGEREWQSFLQGVDVE